MFHSALGHMLTVESDQSTQRMQAAKASLRSQAMCEVNLDSF